MLSTGLLIGSTGGAIASADTGTGSDSQTSSSQSAGGDNASSPVSRPSDRNADTLAKAVRNAVRGITGNLSPIRNRLQERSAITSRPKTSPDADDTTPSATPAAPTNSDQVAPDSDVATADPGVLSTAPDPAESTSTEAASSPATQPTASAPAPATPATQPVAPTSNGTGAVPTAHPPVVNPFEPASKVAAAVTNVATSVGTAVASVPALVMSLPTSETPVYDVITTLQGMLTSVTDSAIPLTQLPADFAAILVAGWNTPAVTDGRPDARSVASSTDTLLRMLQPSQLTSATAISTTRSVPSTAEVAGLSTVGAIAAATSVSHDFVPAGTVVDTAKASDAVPALLKGAAAALLISVSLWALFTAALPGLGGLAAIGATGVRIGYRQAKAGLALHSTELARFAPAGPIGIVRSDSLIVMRPSAVRDVRPDLRIVDRAPNLRLLDRVA